MEYITKSQVAKRYGFDLKSVTNWMNERGADSCWSTDKRKFREPEITEWVIKNIITPNRSVSGERKSYSQSHQSFNGVYYFHLINP